MPLNNAVTRWLAVRLARRAAQMIGTRSPDFVIGDRGDPYLERWWMIPRNRIFNVYLHVFRRSDDDRACHDHPFASVSLALEGDMREVYLSRVRTPDGALTIERERPVTRGDLIYRSARFAHRVIVPPDGAVTLFITGPRIREWGFVCPQGWVPWREFVADGEKGRIGKGCGP